MTRAWRANTIEKVMDRFSPEPNTGCWLWEGFISPGGYGRVKVKGKNTVAHRLVWEHLRGPIPAGLVIDHLCRVRCCVNPDHMEVVTQRENVLRGEGTAAVNARKTHCGRGHELTGANLLPSSRRRTCRICAYLARDEYRRIHGRSRKGQTQHCKGDVDG